MGKSQVSGRRRADRAGSAQTSRNTPDVRQPSHQNADGENGTSSAGHVPEEGSQDGLISLALKNFQKFAKFKVVFDPRVTVLVGASDQGKSTVLRALGAVAVGEPDGAELIRHDTDGYAVQLVVPGHTVVRKRGKSGNVFVLDGATYTRDRSDWPPQKVLDAVRLAPENFQWQLDGPLWFLDSAGTVAKQLNRVVDLEAIDAVQAAANSVAKADLATLEGATQEYESAKHAYQNLKWVPAMSAEWERLEEKGAKLEKARSDKARLQAKLSRLREAGKKKVPQELFAAFLQVATSRLHFVETGEKRKQLASVLARVADLSERSEALSQFRPSFDQLSAVRAEAEKRGQRRAQLETALGQLEDLQRKESECRKRLEEAEAKVAEVETCPTCGQPIGSPSSSPMYTSPIRPHRHG